MVDASSPIRFSVITPTYNRADVVLNSVESVRRQGLGERVEILVIDDNSTDDTRECMREYAATHPDLQLKYIAATGRSGAGGARNIGIAKARGEYLVMLDSDDELMEGALARIDDVLDKNDCAVYLGAVQQKSGRTLRYDKRHADRSLTLADYLRSYEEPEAMAVVRRAILERHKLFYDTDLAIAEGLLYLRILKLGYALYRDANPIRLYDDTRKDSISNTHSMLFDNSEKVARSHERLLSEFGSELRQSNPKLYWKTLLKAAVYGRLAGAKLEPRIHGSIAYLLNIVPSSLLRRSVLYYKERKAS